MFKVMKQKVFQLLQAESKLTTQERSCNQWQLLFQIKGCGDIIVGKGGVNTMFYTVNNSERKLLLPEAMLDKIDQWIIKTEVTTYTVVNKKRVVAKRLSSIDEAKQHKEKGNTIFSVKNGKKEKLMEFKKTMFGYAWVEF